MKKLFLGLLLIAFVFGQKTYNVTQANFMGDVDVADTLTAKIASVSDSLHVDSLSIGKVVSDVDMDGNYTLNSPSLTDLRSNALPSPYYRFDGSNDRIDLDGLATELAVVSNTTGSIVWEGKIIDIITNSNRVWSFGDTDANTGLYVRNDNTDGVLEVTLLDAGTVSWSFTTDVALVADAEHELVLTQNGTSPVLYIDGVPVDITFSVSTDLTAWFGDITGIDNCRVGCGNLNGAGNLQYAEIQSNKFGAWNLALTASEVKEYMNGSIPYKYQGASQAEQVYDNEHITLTAGTSSWSNAIPFAAFDKTGDLSITADNVGDMARANTGYYAMTVGKRYRLSFDIANLVGTFQIGTYALYGGNYNIGIISSADGARANLEFTATDIGGLSFTSIESNSSGDFDNFSLIQIGCVAEYDGSSMTSTTWYDKSGNGLDGSVSGASLENQVVAFDSLKTNQIAAVDATGLKLYDDGGNGIFVEDGGNVGIGTVSPGALLEASSDAASLENIRIRDSGSSGSLAAITFSGAGIGRGKYGFITKTAEGVAKGSWGLLIDGNTGKVGIGSTAPDKQLEINSATGDNLRLTYNDANGSAANYVDYTVSSGGNGTITPSGGNLNLAGNVDVSGGLSAAIVAKSATYTATSSDYTILFTNGAANDTLNLPAAASHSGRIYNVKKVDAGAGDTVVDGNGAETIDGASVQTITNQYDSITIQSDGSNWHIL